MTSSGPQSEKSLIVPEKDLAAFRGVDAWVFDLDNTLYPAEADLFSQIRDRITDYVAQLLKLPRDEAQLKQRDYFRTYGTTMRGLVVEHDINAAEFLAFVHDIDYSPVAQNTALAEALVALPGKKFIFTNGDRPHAERTTAALGISGLFDDIFDIVAADLLPKPALPAYEKFFAHTGVAPEHAAMFEDMPRNLDVPHQLGMRTTLVVSKALGERGARPTQDADGKPHGVDFLTQDLAAFLGIIGKALRS